MRPIRESSAQTLSTLPRFVRVLLAEAAAKHGTTPGEIIGGSQEARITTARWEVIKNLRNDRRRFSLHTIGRWMRRDHSSVLHALQQMRAAYPNSKHVPEPAPFDPDAPDESGIWNV